VAGAVGVVDVDAALGKGAAHLGKLPRLVRQVELDQLGLDNLQANALQDLPREHGVARPEPDDTLVDAVQDGDPLDVDVVPGELGRCRVQGPGLIFERDRCLPDEIEFHGGLVNCAGLSICQFWRHQDPFGDADFGREAGKGGCLLARPRMALPLTELLPDEDYRFHLTLRRGNLAEFFGHPDPAVLAERRAWLSRHPERFAGAMHGGDAAIAELEDLAPRWLGISTPPPMAGQSPRTRVVTLGGALGADFMLMARDEAGVFRLRAGVVCFPSMWALEEKMGKTLEDIHGHVPGLNPAIGGAIGQFLGRLKPDAPYERANWGLAATPELNLHPSLGRPRLVSPVDPSGTWLRVEDQIFAAMPISGAILFGIQIRLVPLSEIAADPRLREGLRRAMATMSEELASYKGLAGVRAEVAGALA